MSNRRPLIAGNWKMNGLLAHGRALAQAVAERRRAEAGLACDVLVCPPFTLLGSVAQDLAGSGVALGGQDCHATASGAHTGDIAAAMLRDIGCTHVILGHSERRADHGETDDAVRDKVAAAHAAGLIAVLCVGETLAQRDAGLTMQVNRTQLLGSLPEGANAANTVIAYEPVWAIGTGRVASPEQAQEVHAAIRSVLTDRLGAAEAGALRILYGGSMKPDNAAALLALPDVDGGLIGGAALKADDFWAIARACA
jgi:triosephosphate isomerase (TIM)